MGDDDNDDNGDGVDDGWSLATHDLTYTSKPGHDDTKHFLWKGIGESRTKRTATNTSYKQHENKLHHYVNTRWNTQKRLLIETAETAAIIMNTDTRRLPEN